MPPTENWSIVGRPNFAIQMTWDNLFSGAAGAGLIALAHWAYNWWTRPHLSVSFQQSKPGFIVFTREIRPIPGAATTIGFDADATESYDAMFASIRIRNTGRRNARSCRGFLVGIDTKRNGRWEPTDYCDSIPLAWSYRSDADALHGIDIPRGVDQFLNIFSVRQPRIHRGFLPATVPKTLRGASQACFERSGEFRFRIQVAADDLPAQLFGIYLRWPGNWDNEPWNNIPREMQICQSNDLY